MTRDDILARYAGRPPALRVGDVYADHRYHRQRITAIAPAWAQRELSYHHVTICGIGCGGIERYEFLDHRLTTLLQRGITLDCQCPVCAATPLSALQIEAQPVPPTKLRQLSLF